MKGNRWLTSHNDTQPKPQEFFLFWGAFFCAVADVDEPDGSFWVYLNNFNDMGVSKNTGTPKWMMKIMEPPIQIHDLGVPLFWKHPYSWMYLEPK